MDVAVVRERDLPKVLLVVCRQAKRMSRLYLHVVAMITACELLNNFQLSKDV